MTNIREQALGILARLGAQPATSFLEDGVTRVVRDVLDEAHVSHYTDAYGNIIAHLAGASADGSVPPIAFMAHMDHPGFEAVAVDGDFLVGAAMGGVPQSSFEDGVPLQVVLPGGERLSAVTSGPFGEPSERKVLINLENASRLPEIPLPSSVVFDLVDFQLEDGYIRMRALDDLAGCGSALAMLSVLVGESEQPVGDVYGVFTRAEEVGTGGCAPAGRGGNLAKRYAGGVAGIQPHPARGGDRQRAGDTGGRRRFHLQRRRGIAPDPRPGDVAGSPRGVQGAAATDERRHLRGQRIFRLRLSHHWHRLPPGQLPQRRPRRRH